MTIMEHITINSDRSVTVPVELRKIGVQYDHNVNVLSFICPRYSGNVDLSTMSIYINYILSDKTPGKYKADNVTICEEDDTLVRFDWTITRNVTQVSGVLSCLVCAKKTDEEGNEVNHWNTEIFRLLSVSEGMENDQVIQEQYPDVITSLFQKIEETDTKLLEFSGLSTIVSDLEDSVDELKDDLVDVDTRLSESITEISDVLEIEKDPSSEKTVNSGTNTILSNVQTKQGFVYKATYSLKQPSSMVVYVNVKKESDDSTISSRAIQSGNLETTITWNGENETVYATATTYVDGVTIGVVVESNEEKKKNAIERLDEKTDGVIEEAKKVLGLSVAKGYNLKTENGVQTGEGAYYDRGGVPYLNTSGSYGSDYNWYIFPVKKNTYYSTSVTPRWIVLVGDDGKTVSSNVTGKLIYTGNATKMYFTLNRMYMNQFAISEGFIANYADKKVLSVVSLEDNNFGNSFPVDTMYFSVGITERLYYNNIMAISSDVISLITACNGQAVWDSDGITVTPIAPFSNPNNAVRIEHFDDKYHLIYKPQYSGLVIKNMNIKDCSCLVIGDSTVGSWGTMTQHMLDKFTELGKTLTLLGTRGQSATNRHEGRGGWSAKLYCTEASHGDYTNPFLNNGHFDFSYYMNQQGYNTPDFVVIQLGINDVYNATDDFETMAIEALMYEKEMIDSILAYDSSIKIIINPPTTPTLIHANIGTYPNEILARNHIIRYAMMLRRLALMYSNNNVRCSNMNLIIDSKTEIRDNVHPTELGFNKMGDELVSQINCWQN